MIGHVALVPHSTASCCVTTQGSNAPTGKTSASSVSSLGSRDSVNGCSRNKNYRYWVGKKTQHRMFNCRTESGHKSKNPKTHIHVHLTSAMHDGKTQFYQWLKLVYILDVCVPTCLSYILLHHTGPYLVSIRTTYRSTDNLPFKPSRPGAAYSNRIPGLQTLSYTHVALKCL